MGASHRLYSAIISIVLLLFSSPAAAQPATTVITHGYSLSGEKGVWVETMAEAIIARAGGDGAVMRYDQPTGAWRAVTGSPQVDQPLVLIARWLNDFEKTGPNFGFAEAAADAIYAALRDPMFIDQDDTTIPAFNVLNDRPVHFIGHSRGTCVNSEIVERLALADIPVDHVTTLDPHPVDGTLDPPLDFDWGDPMPRTWSNVTFADNYWRADGGAFNATDFDGIPIKGAFNVQLDESTLNCCAYSLSHLDVHLWYHGTIDLAPNPCDGEQCITDFMRNTWWPDGYVQSGYWYAALGGGADDRPGFGPTVSPGPVPTLYGGSFENASFAGWLYHGGFVNGDIVTENSRTFLRLGGGAGNEAQHNRFVLRASSCTLRFALNVFTADTTASEQLHFVFIERDGTQYATAPVALDDETNGWIEHRVVALPAGLQSDTTYLLEISVTGDPDITAVVGIDDLRISDQPIGDVDGDGQANVADLLALLSAWGPCAGCAQDIDGSGAVDIGDLLVLLAAWGECS